MSFAVVKFTSSIFSLWFGNLNLHKPDYFHMEKFCIFNILGFPRIKVPLHKKSTTNGTHDQQIFN